VLGDSILTEIRRMRIEKAKHLLTETDLKLSVIAQQCGIRGSARLTTVFKQVTGYPPSLFRRFASDRQIDRGQPSSSYLSREQNQQIQDPHCS
jgi:transcriptional regulator GlxA family with amidase domain